MARERRPRVPESGWGFIAIGLIIGILGALAVISDTESAGGWIVFGIGQTLTAVGVVAVGVTVGTRRAAYLRQFDQQ